MQSTSGGTGSGLWSRLLVDLDSEYENKLKRIWISLLPSPSISVNHIEHFNTIMWLNSYLNFSQLGIVLDNQACYRYAKQFLGINKWSYKDVNSIIANLYSNLTSTFRFNSIHKDESITPFYLTDLLTEWVPYHQINSLYASVVPIKPYVRK